MDPEGPEVDPASSSWKGGGSEPGLDSEGPELDPASSSQTKKSNILHIHWFACFDKEIRSFHPFCELRSTSWLHSDPVT